MIDQRTLMAKHTRTFGLAFLVLTAFAMVIELID